MRWRLPRHSDTGGDHVSAGLDVGKGGHHATAVTPAGKKAFDERLRNGEPKPREVFDKLQAKHRSVLVVVDQPASIGALPLAVAQDMGCPVAYLPGLTMRRIADLYRRGQTDARDAFVIADAARVMPHTLRSVDLEDETIARLEMIVGFDDDLAGEAIHLSNHLRGLGTQIHPSLDPTIGCPAWVTDTDTDLSVPLDAGGTSGPECELPVEAYQPQPFRELPTEDGSS